MKERHKSTTMSPAASSSNNSNIPKSNNTITTSNTLEELTQFSPAACVDCRNNHRKCDRKKPKCDACHLRGLTCTYTKTMKRKFKKLLIHNNLEEDCSMIDFYFNLACYGLPMVEKEELKQFVSLLAENDGKVPENATTTTSTPPQRSGTTTTATTTVSTNYSNGSDAGDKLYEMAALYYSIKATCESVTSETMENSEKAAAKAKEYLSRVFDRHSSLLVVACYFYLCCYDLTVGRVESSQLYFQILLYVKEQLNRKSFMELNTLERNAYEGICHIEQFMFDEQGMVRELTFELTLQSLPRLFVFDKSNLPDGWSYYLNNPHLIDSSNCLEVWAMVEMILQESQGNDLHIASNYAEMIYLYYTIAMNGLRIAFLSKCSNANSSPMIEYSLENSASTLVEAIQNPHFKCMPWEMMVYVSIVAKYHLEKVTKGLLFSRKGISYYEMLFKEHQAYITFTQKFPITAFHFSKTFSQIEQLFNNNMQLQQQEKVL